jgi:hypothetical protein
MIPTKALWCSWLGFAAFLVLFAQDGLPASERLATVLTILFFGSIFLTVYLSHLYGEIDTLRRELRRRDEDNWALHKRLWVTAHLPAGSEDEQNKAWAAWLAEQDREANQRLALAKKKFPLKGLP